MTSMTIRPVLGSPIPDAKPATAQNSPKSLWVWMAVTCLLLGISGGFRFWREWQFQTLADASTTCPFPVKDLPKSLGGWGMVEGSQGQLDPEVAQTAGASEHNHFRREYIDEKSGERVSILVLYGLAHTVFAHTPDSCYPASGYRLVLGPEDRQLSIPGVTTPVQCRAAIYAKKVGSVVRYEEVYWTFFHNKEWLPELKDRWKSFRYHPGAFKIQLQRPVSRLTFEDSPTEALLSEFVQDIGKRTSANPKGGAKNEKTPAQVASGTTSVRSE
jgi:hypothetical protein